MNKIFIFVSFLAVIAGCKENTQEQQADSLPFEQVVEVDYGNINVGQTDYYTAQITNKTEQPLFIDAISVCCGNEKPEVSGKKIGPGSSIEFSQKIHKKKYGQFKIESTVHFSKPEGLAKKYIITGTAIQPIIVRRIGWMDRALIEAETTQDRLRLDKVHKSCNNNLVLELSHNSDLDILLKGKADYKATYFSLLNTSIVKNEQTGEMCCRVTLKASDELAVGELADEIIVRTDDGTECYIPIVFRTVGDVYCEKSLVSLGKIEQTVLRKDIKILFSEDVDVWRTIKYNIDGKLSDAVKVVSQKINENSLDLVLEIDGGLVEVGSGYASSNITFSSDQPQKDEVKVLLYGYL